MSILVTGAGGFIGSHCVMELLSSTNEDVIALDNFKYPADVARIETDCGYKIMKHDLTLPFTPRELKLLEDVEYIVNYASNSDVDASIKNPMEVWTNNTQLVMNMLELARRLPKLKHFIQYSTDEIYGPTFTTNGHKEWEAAIPSNVYAASKAAQEALAIAYFRQYNLPITITNSMNIIGTKQSITKFLTKVIEAVMNNKEITIHASNGVIGNRWYCDVRDNVAAVKHILFNLTPDRFKDGHPHPSRYNIVGKEKLDNLEFALLVADKMGKKLKYKMQDAEVIRPGWDQNYGLDGSKLATSGWTPSIPIADTVKWVVEWTRTNPEWIS